MIWNNLFTKRRSLAMNDWFTFIPRIHFNFIRPLIYCFRFFLAPTTKKHKKQITKTGRKINEKLKVLKDRSKRVSKRRRRKRGKKNKHHTRGHHKRPKNKHRSKKKFTGKTMSDELYAKKRRKMKRRRLIKRMIKLRIRKEKNKISQYWANMHKRRRCLLDQFIKDNEMTLKFTNRKYPSQFYHLSRLQEIRKTLQLRGKLKGCSVAV